MARPVFVAADMGFAMNKDSVLLRGSFRILLLYDVGESIDLSKVREILGECVGESLLQIDAHGIGIDDDRTSRIAHSGVINGMRDADQSEFRIVTAGHRVDEGSGGAGAFGEIDGE